jgi:hypothetical protein
MNAWQWVGLAVLAAVSAVIFAAYQRPDTMVSLTNAFLALCGFR